ncbi:BON domain-containing protein [Undibacterium sp. Jales W-56]|uniref:BON domain-containing protein n=1 Tax=Undibacterium sp. Jales W-56 TaxID=2897325 RepID=UPI0021D378AB|nr:BON domain-containing protein [Undibacterium sp. Jales W-56]MCU6433997.1 BON domain-containing protein [Undibacterium sp. Jales W-56]
MRKLNTGIFFGAAGALLVLLAGCNKPTDIAGPSAPSITVGTQIDDTVVSAKVSSALMSNEDIKGYDIKVAVRKGEVMLSGFVDNQAQIDKSIAVTRAVEGVTNVDNKLVLKPSSRTIGNKIDDGVITAKVKSALLADSAVKSFDIGVVTSKGDVQLSGFADSETQIVRATEVTKGIEGVQKVTNQMSVKK